jgi:hypothetical protein
MGGLGLVVFCRCTPRGPLPEHAWGEHPTEDHYLSDEQIDLFHRWEYGVREVPCSHRDGLEYYQRFRDAACPLAWAVAAALRPAPEPLVVMSRLKTPAGDFQGDAVVIPPRDALALAREIDVVIRDGIPPIPYRRPDDPDEPRVVEIWREAIAASQATDGPIVIGWSY